MEYIDPDLFEKFHNIEKEQIGSKNFSKWQNYEIKIQEDMIEKLKKFNPIDE